MTRFDAVIYEGRHCGQRYHRLRNEIARCRLQLRGELIAFALACRRAHQHSIAARAVDGLDDERIQMMQNMLELFGLRTAPRGNVWENRVLVEVVANHVGHVGVHQLVIRDARTGSISQSHVAFRPGAHQSRNAERRLRAEGFRIKEVIVDPPVDHIDTGPAVDRLHVHAVIVVYCKISALDELAAHLPREIRMFEVRRVVDTGREHHDLRHSLASGRQRHQHLMQLGGVIVDRKDRSVLKQLRKHALHDLPVLDHVGNTGRYTQVVLEHVDSAVFVAHQIRAADVGPAALRRTDTDAIRPEVLRGRDDVVRKQTVLDDTLRVIHIVDEVIERRDALFQARRDPVPLPRGNDARNDIEWPGAIDRAAVLVIPGEGHSHHLDGEFRGLLAHAELLTSQLRQVSYERTTGDTRTATRADQFVMQAGWAVAGPIDAHQRSEGAWAGTSGTR